MADTVGMTLVLRADSRGVVAEMKNASGAVVDTARIMRSQFQNATNESTNSLAKMKTEMGRARETAMFFTQALGEFGPGGRTAQIAISGIAGAIMGGGGILLALSLAQAAVRVLVDWWKEDAEAAKEASKKHAEAAKAAEEYNRALAGQGNDAIAKLKAMRTAQVGQTDAQRAHSEVLKVNQALQLATAPAIQAMLRQRLAEAKALEEAIRLYERAEAAQEKADKAAKERTQRDAAKAKEVEEAARRGQAALDARARAYERAAAAEMAADAKRNESGQKALDARARAYEASMKTLANAAQQVQAEWQAAGGAIASTLGDLGSVIGGAAQSWMQYFGQLIQKAIQLAIAIAAGNSGPLGWLNAVAAGAAVIAAVTSVPEFRAMGGPVDSGSPYIVGERGPELFIPGASGGIVPNHALGGGGTTVNLTLNAMDAKSVRRLFLENNGALAEAIGRAVRDGRRFA